MRNILFMCFVFFNIMSADVAMQAVVAPSIESIDEKPDNTFGNKLIVEGENHFYQKKIIVMALSRFIKVGTHKKYIMSCNIEHTKCQISRLAGRYEYNNKGQKDGVWYYMELHNGYYLKKEEHYKNGVLEMTREYNKKGFLANETTYKDKEEDTVSKYYDNGRIMRSVNDSMVKAYFPNGKLLAEMDRKTWNYKVYTSDGSILEEQNVKNGYLDGKNLHFSGSKQEDSINDINKQDIDLADVDVVYIAERRQENYDVGISDTKKSDDLADFISGNQADNVSTCILGYYDYAKDGVSKYNSMGTFAGTSKLPPATGMHNEPERADSLSISRLYSSIKCQKNSK